MGVRLYPATTNEQNLARLLNISLEEYQKASKFHALVKEIEKIPSPQASADYDYLLWKMAQESGYPDLDICFGKFNEALSSNELEFVGEVSSEDPLAKELLRATLWYREGYLDHLSVNEVVELSEGFHWS